MKVKKLLVGVAFVTLAACASVPKTPEEQVRARAAAYLNALLAQDTEKAYQFTSPAYRSMTNLSLYRLRVAGIGSWISGEVGRVECSEDVCDVESIIDYRVGPARLANTRPLNHRWIKSDGQWWISLR